MRLDLLESPYGQELSRMVDRMPPFPSDHSIAIIERTTGKPLQETFAQFDPEPVVSTTTACTYQAVLPAGMKEAQAEYTRVLYTFRTKAKYTEWWERTSARQWLALVKVARQFDLPLNLYTLRMIRATLLYDTLILRLDRSIDRYKEYSNFMSDRARWARKRWQKRVRDARRQFVSHVNELRETGSDLLENVQHMISSPVAGFSSLIDKSVFAFSVVTRMIGRLLALTALAAAAVGTNSYFQTGVVPVIDTLLTVMQSRLYQFVVLVELALNLRLILFRFGERDVVK